MVRIARGGRAPGNPLSRAFEQAFRMLPVARQEAIVPVLEVFLDGVIRHASTEEVAAAVQEASARLATEDQEAVFSVFAEVRRLRPSQCGPAVTEV